MDFQLVAHLRLVALDYLLDIGAFDLNGIATKVRPEHFQHPQQDHVQQTYNKDEAPTPSSPPLYYYAYSRFLIHCSSCQARLSYYALQGMCPCIEVTFLGFINRCHKYINARQVVISIQFCLTLSYS